jgi:hypothetical protein
VSLTEIFISHYIKNKEHPYNTSILLSNNIVGGGIWLKNSQYYQIEMQVTKYKPIYIFSLIKFQVNLIKLIFD